MVQFWLDKTVDHLCKMEQKWNRGHNGLHHLGQPVAPSILFPVFKSEGEPGTYLIVLQSIRVHIEKVLEKFKGTVMSLYGVSSVCTLLTT